MPSFRNNLFCQFKKTICLDKICKKLCFKVNNEKCSLKCILMNFYKVSNNLTIIVQNIYLYTIDNVVKILTYTDKKKV